jgi:DHA1 family inner membrane transport protein
MALSALVGAAGGMLLGRNIDGGDGKRSVLIAYAVVAAAVALRAASAANPGLPWLAVTANAPGAMVTALQATAMMSVVYNMAQASPCPLRFHMATEGGWDVGCATACLMAAGLSALGQSLGLAILMALPVMSLTVILLRRYHHDRAVSAPVEG